MSNNKIIEVLVILLDGNMVSAAINDKRGNYFSSELSSDNDWNTISANREAHKRINTNSDNTASVKQSNRFNFPVEYNNKKYNLENTGCNSSVNLLNAEDRSIDASGLGVTETNANLKEMLRIIENISILGDF